ncbi:peptidase M14 [Nakamurella silvestris]|nr:peptidase M14 [Nakamurella silvestris]
MSLNRVMAGACSGVLVTALLFAGAPSALASSPPSSSISAATLSAANLSEIASSFAAEPGYPRQSTLRTYPENLADASVNRGVIRFDEIAPKLNQWMQSSNRISVEVIGESSQGRDLYLITVTAPETPQQTAQQTAWRQKIKENPAAAAADTALQAGYKIPIWFNNNIHGNEWDGTDASLNYVQKLITAPDAEVNALLSTSRIYFTATNNPDGRVGNTRATALGLDPNRDFITNQTPETTAFRDIIGDIQPLYFSDIHGYTNILQIEPCGPPHGENYDYDLFIPHAYASALRIEADVIAAAIPGNTYQSATGGVTTTPTNKLLIPYRDTPSGWDDWPPVFTAQYAAFYGAVAQTMELPLGRVTNVTTNKANAAVNIKVAEVAIKSTIDYVMENKAEMLANQIEIFRRGAAGEALRPISSPVEPGSVPGPTQWQALWGPEDQYTTEFPRAYVIPVGTTQRSATDAATLVDHLINHNVAVTKATSAFVAAGKSYPAGSYIVNMHQPMRGLANALLAAGSDVSLKLPSMYDISAWSLGYLWGATVVRVGNTSNSFNVATTPVAIADPTGVMPAAGSYLTFKPVGSKEIQALNSLLAAGVPVATVADGSVVIAPDQATKVAAAVAQFGIQVKGTNGRELLAPGVHNLKSLRVGYVGGADDLLTLKELGFANPTLVSAALLQAGTVDLANIDVLWMAGNLTFTGAQTVASAQMDAYLAAGKGIVGRGTGANTFANARGLVTATATAGNTSANGIIKVSNNPDGLLGAFGQDYVFVSAPVSFSALGGNTVALQTYGAGNPVLSGHWRSTNATNGPEIAGGKASVITGTSATGSKAIVFGTYPTFRTHPKGMFGDLSRSLFSVALEGTAVVKPSHFDDIAVGAPFFDEIEWLFNEGITEGFQVGNKLLFRPGAAVERQATAAFLYRYEGNGWTPVAGTQTFADVPVTHPFYKEIEWMAFKGLSTGTANPVSGLKPLFKSTDSVSRQAFAAFLFRLAGEPAFSVGTGFTDVKPSHPFYTEISWLASTGISTGFGGGLFKPGATVDRQTTAAFLKRFDAL